MRGALTEKAQKEIEEMWQLRRECVILLGHVNAEWKSDPSSVAGFDLRLVKRTDEVLKRLNKLDPFYEGY